MAIDICNQNILAGKLLGYQIHVKDCNGSAFHSNVTLNATTTHFVLTNLSLGHEYTVRAVAFTKLGPGPFSAPETFRMDPAMIRTTVPDLVVSQDAAAVTNEPWFVALLGSVIVVSLAVAFAGVIAYRWVLCFHRKMKVSP